MARLTEYTDEQIAHALAVLASNGGNAKKTAAQLGISRTTLRGWAGRHTNKTGKSRQVDAAPQTEARARLAVKFRTLAEELVESANSEEKRAKAGVKDLLIAAGIATEKSELLAGGPTSRTEQVRVSLMTPDSLRSGALRVIEGGRKEVKSA